MKLKILIKDIPSLQIRGNKDAMIKGISANSKNVGPGFLFLVKQGKSFDGSNFIKEALQGGASVILSQNYHPFLEGITQLIHPHPALLERILTERFYDTPAKKLKIMGVTGTNGKTTVTYLIRYLLEKAKKGCGLIGTIEWSAGSKVYTPTHTTPDIMMLNRLFSDMVLARQTYVAIEVTSHALSQNRIEGVDMHTAIFTNLSQDHLDYHKTLDDYARAKASLFERLSSSSFAIINQDDSYSSLMIKGCRAHIYSYGIDQAATLKASHLIMSAKGMEFRVTWKGEQETFKTQLIGKFNVYNILAALTACLIEGLTLQDMKLALAEFKGIPGRLERVPNVKKLPIFVDYAHTPDALENVLKTLQELKDKGRIITVYGCGGDRDASKRPLMGKIAEEGSDIAILTTDNPRKEDAREIASQVLKGCTFPEKMIVELDRKAAIYEAVRLAKPQDIILIAGKGHEKTQVFAYRTVSFDDCLIAQEACRS
ncbi:UDP-N-acetylmuramoyl-L-alanyl-D-glutamate--2,6-diaminopimelate ligase [Rhabdochlamydiaceae symbiont of Dictyostelium giganteum]|uniref:UDP-N-acetylmuramoyl-L-alanyl-D-glutamate--2, 6-diaminopimelate ligase n=1 Tax=Rhabdochlamydiaceae symbiont of Dictyostelium giganteum TaxID=3342349 RepID=UPI00384E8327